MHTIEQVQEWLTEESDAIPRELLAGLNGGIYLLPDIKYSSKIPSNDYFVMGEYIRDQALGCYILIYYGSFMAVWVDADVQTAKYQLRHILLHEVRHHVESRGLLRDLELEDERFIAEACDRIRTHRSKT